MEVKTRFKTLSAFFSVRPCIICFFVYSSVIEEYADVDVHVYYACCYSNSPETPVCCRDHLPAYDEIIFVMALEV